MKSALQKCFVPGVLLVAVLVAAPAHAEYLDADLSGYNEVPTISSSGKAEFRARINREGTEIQYVLKYSDLTTELTQAHLHLGKRGTNGAVIVYLCSNLYNGPLGTQLCPVSPGEVRGTLTAASVIGPAIQGISPGDLVEALTAIRAGVAYADVHTRAFPAGEVRGQVERHFYRFHHDD